MWHFKIISRVAGTYLRAAFIWRLDATNYFNWDISIFCITLTELTSFDFDYIGAAVLIWGQYTIKGGHIWNKYGLVLISMLIKILTCTFFVGEKGSHYMAERPDF